MPILPLNSFLVPSDQFSSQIDVDDDLLIRFIGRRIVSFAQCLRGTLSLYKAKGYLSVVEAFNRSLSDFVTGRQELSAGNQKQKFAHETLEFFSADFKLSVTRTCKSLTAEFYVQTTSLAIFSVFLILTSCILKLISPIAAGGSF